MSKQRDVCCLSEEEVGRLTNYNEHLNHDHHKHIPLNKTVKLLDSGVLELFEHEGKHYVRHPKLYYIRPRLSGGVPVMQRVISNRPKHITPAVMLDLSKE